MCFSLIWKDLFKSIKTFRLKSQLLLCYISGISLVMIVLIFTIYILLNELENSTVYEIEDTLNTINRHNSKDFSQEYALTIENLLNNTAITSSYINFYMSNLQSQPSSPFRRPYITTYDELPRECTVKLPQYEENYVCLNYSSVTYSNSSHKVTDDLGYLAYILPEIFTLLSPFIHRILIYVPQENSTIVFPGQRLPQDYLTSQSIWFNTLISHPQEPFVFVSSYNDSLNTQPVISLAQKIEMGSAEVGLNVEMQEGVLYSLFSANAYLLESEEKLLTNASGWILYNKKSSLFKSREVRFMKEFNEDIWDAAKGLRESENLFFLHDNENFYRVSIEKIPKDSQEPWLYLFLFLKEKTLMKYKNETQDTLNSFSYLLIGLTCIIGVIIIIVSAIIVNLTGSSVSKPLIGIKNLTDRINVGEVKIEEELDKLEEGTEQVAELVRAFKSLATTISTRRHADVQVRSKKQIFPPNELYRTNRITWKVFFKNIPE